MTEIRTHGRREGKWWTNARSSIFAAEENPQMTVYHVSENPIAVRTRMIETFGELPENLKVISPDMYGREHTTK